MLVCDEKEVMPQEDSIKYACSVEHYKPPKHRLILTITLVVAVIVLALDVLVWRA